MESIVRRINRHKRQALIELEIMGDVRMVTVALEIVKKVSDNSNFDDTKRDEIILSKVQL